MIKFKDCIVFLLAKGNQKAHRNLKKRLKSYGITPVQALVLGALEEENGLTASEIGRRLGLDNATVSGVLDRLRDSNWIIKRPDPQDRRPQLICLPENTDEKVIMKMYKARTEANEETLQNLSLEERVLLRRLLKDLV